MITFIKTYFIIALIVFILIEFGAHISAAVDNQNFVIPVIKVKHFKILIVSLFFPISLIIAIIKLIVAVIIR